MRSAAFRVRFRFVRVVRAVRASEAKLRGRMTIVVSLGFLGASVPMLWPRQFASFLVLLVFA